MRKKSLSLIVCVSVAVSVGCKNDNSSDPTSSSVERSEPIASLESTVEPLTSPEFVLPDADPIASESAPVIRGTPSPIVKAGEEYLFRPQTSDEDNDKLTFQIVNRPRWTSFDPETGTLAGVPTFEHIGYYEAISITVSDEEYSEALGPFTIEVVSVGEQSITLSWLSPLENEDGTPLTDLGGFMIRYGRESDIELSLIAVDNPGLTSYVIDGLTPGTYLVTLSAYNASGVESDPSGELAFTIS